MSHFMFTKTWTPPRLKSSIKNNNNKTVWDWIDRLDPAAFYLSSTSFFSFNNIPILFFSPSLPFPSPFAFHRPAMFSSFLKTILQYTYICTYSYPTGHFIDRLAAGVAARGRERTGRIHTDPKRKKKKKRIKKDLTPPLQSTESTIGSFHIFYRFFFLLKKMAIVVTVRVATHTRVH